MSTHELPRPGSPPVERGSTWIADQIVAKIAASAAREVEGVADLRGGGMRRGWVRASDRGRGAAAGVRIEGGSASIDLRLRSEERRVGRECRDRGQLDETA